MLSFKNQAVSLITILISSTYFVGGLSASLLPRQAVIPQNYISADLTAADAPGQPTAADGYEPPKKWDGKKVKNPNKNGAGWPDKKGDVWVPTGPGGDAHGGPHWDVQTPGGSYRNVYPGGKVR